MQNFTAYWTNETWRDHAADKAIDFAASNQFVRAGVRSGDRVFIVTNEKGKLLLGGALTVKRLLTKAQAVRRWGKDIWPGSHFIDPVRPSPFHERLAVSTRDVRRLRFEEGKSVLYRGSAIDQQTLRGVRELTSESADILAGLLSTQGRKARGSAKDQTIEAIFDAWPTQSARKLRAALIDAINAAHERDSARWTINLTRKRIRLNVGTVLCMQINADELLALATDDAEPLAPEWSPDPYTFAPSCGNAVVSNADSLRFPAALRAANLRAIGICSDKHKGNKQYRSAYTEEILEYLERTDHVTLPRPSWLADQDGKADEKDDRYLSDSPDMSTTMKESVRKYRCAQGKFRDRVRKIEVCCRVTGETEHELLIASHIKPWRDSDDKERQDGHNGLLLAPHIDRLFDLGRISFSDDGDLLIRDRKVEAVLKLWGVPYPLNVKSFDKRQKRYLAYHRKAHSFPTK